MGNYVHQWDLETGGYLLVPSVSPIRKEIRPVFHEELDLLGFKQYWQYPNSKEPLMWAEGSRRYFYGGELVAEAVGGGFYAKPELRVFKADLCLRPVDISSMVERNKTLMDGVIQASLEFIDRVHREHRRKKLDQFVVAFSGGKDSLVLLDLVQRALPPEDFTVVFSDTGMELSSTYEAIERAKSRWSNLKFYTVKSQKDPRTTWGEFGPPSRLQRWCCTVHKSAPTLLFMRRLNMNKPTRVVVFDGVRREESDARSAYLEVSEGVKHVRQINVRPLLSWTAAELFLYIFDRAILLNDAYRYGVVRVGCSVCPMSSSWRNHIGNQVYPDDLRPYLDELRLYAERAGVPTSQVDEFIDEGGWKARAGGKFLPDSGSRVLEQIDGDTVSFLVRDPKIHWREILRLFGTHVVDSDGHGEVNIDGKFYPIRLVTVGKGVRIDLSNMNPAVDRMALYHCRCAVNKMAYCTGCQACEVECPTGALETLNGFEVNEAKCTHCYSCLSAIDRGCMMAKSLCMDKAGGGNSRMKGMDRYATFGMRQEWLASYFSKLDAFWLSAELGNKQYKAMNVWLREVGVTQNNKLSPLGKMLSEAMGVHQTLAWAVMWTNLAYNSTIVGWYVRNVAVGSVETKETLVTLLGDQYANSTRRNAVDALVGLFRYTPLGEGLKFGALDMHGNVAKSIRRLGWQEPDSVAVLYALYCYAEKTGGHYQFTMSELRNCGGEGAGIDPMTLFGTGAATIERIIRGTAETNPDLIKVDFMRDLDSIRLNPKVRPEDVLRAGLTALERGQ